MKKSQLKSELSKTNRIGSYTKHYLKSAYDSLMGQMKKRKEKILIIDRSILYAMGLKSYLMSYPVLKKSKYDLLVNVGDLDKLNINDYKFIFIDFECFKECIMYFRNQNNIPNCCLVLTFLGNCIFEPQQLRALGINGSIDKTKSKKEFLEQLVEMLVEIESQKNNHEKADFLISQRTWLYSSIIEDNFKFKSKYDKQLLEEL